MGELRVMTWNVQNLFGVGDESGPRTQRDFNAKIASLRDVIDAERPHVLALQELGPEANVIALQESLTHKMPQRAMGTPDRRGIRVGFLSTRRLRDIDEVSAFPTGLLPVQSDDEQPGPQGPLIMNGMGRRALRVTIRANNHDVAIYSCHLKSKLITFPGGRFSTRDEGERARQSAYALFRRSSEAATLRVHANDTLGGRGREEPVIVTGDFNDELHAATTQIIAGPPGSELGTKGFAIPDRGDGDRLWNLAPLIDEADRFTRVYRGRGELIDHVFASHFLVSADRTVSVRTVTAMGVPLPSIDDNPNEMLGKPGSDHAAIVATFDF